MNTTTTAMPVSTTEDGGFHFRITSDVAEAASKSVASVLVLFIIGILASWFPTHPSKAVLKSGIVPQSALKYIAKVGTTLLLPSLAFSSLASTLTKDTIKEAWPMIFWTPVHMTIAFAVSTFLFKILRFPKKFFVEFIIGSVFLNIVALPLVLLQVLCQQDVVTEGTMCFQRASSFVFLPKLSWDLTFWTVGFAAIKFVNTGERPPVKKMLLSFLSNPIVIANIAAFIVIFIPSLQKALFDKDGALFFIVSALNVLRQSTVGIMTLILAITLGKSMGGPHNVWKKLSSCCKKHDDNTEEENVVSTTEEEKGMEPSMEEGIVAEETGVNVNEMSELTPSMGQWTTPMFITFIFVSMILLPLVRLGLLFGLGDKIFEGDNKDLIMLVLGIQALSPTANLIIGACQQVHARLVAERLSRGILIQYCVGIATILIFTAIVVGYIYGQLLG